MIGHGDIMVISRLRMASDGEGISTLIGFQGCPLHCKYCLNNFCHNNEETGQYEPLDLLLTLIKDDIYFKMTGGGVVFGGGEPLLQAAFIKQFCLMADPLWKKRIETSLYAPWKDVNLLIKVIDEWIVDIKDMNPDIYRRYTGRNNEQVIDNLNKLIKRVPETKVTIRVPHIKGFNSEEDVKNSISIIRQIGYSNIDVFTYLT